MILLRLGTTELLLILAIVLLLFGATRIPELMRSLGKGIRAFKKGMQEDDDQPAEKKSDTEYH